MFDRPPIDRTMTLGLVLLATAFAASVWMATHQTGPQFAMTEVIGLGDDGYFNARHMIPDQVRAMSEPQE